MTQRKQGTNPAYNLTYGAENHLSGVSGAATAAFVYDGDGRRVKATLGGVTSAFVGNYFEWSGSTSTMIKYFYAGTQRVAMKKGSTVYFLLGDHLGCTALTTNSSGTKVGKLRYKAWGETRFSSGTTYTNRHFTGQLDETSSIGLYFFNARFYDPVLGRFSSADSLIPEPGNPQAWDRFAGMYNNPVRFIDPTGHGVDCGIWESNCKSSLKQIKEHNKKTLTLSQNKLNKEKKRTEITISSNTTNGQKYGLIFTGITMVVGFTAAELSLGVAGVAAASTGPAAIVFDALIVIPTELILIDVEIATVRYIYDVVKTGTKEGKEIEFILLSFQRRIEEINKYSCTKGESMYHGLNR